ncbi:MAG: hypothetical protein ABIC04_08195 [Nanoarchaeota archaeon]
MKNTQEINFLQILILTMPMVGVIIGAILQHIFSSRSSSEKHLKELETQAYIDFIKAAARINSAQREKNVQKEEEHAKLMLDAKTRICVYGEKDVVSSMANFWREGAKLTNPSEMKKFIEIIKSIRKANKIKEIEDKNISQLLFSLDL